MLRHHQPQTNICFHVDFLTLTITTTPTLRPPAPPRRLYRRDLINATAAAPHRQRRTQRQRKRLETQMRLEPHVCFFFLLFLYTLLKDLLQLDYVYRMETTTTTNRQRPRHSQYVYGHHHTSSTQLSQTTTTGA
jgi:hypothetical protein